MNMSTSVAVADSFISDMDLKIRLAQDALVSAQAIQSKHVNKKHRDVKQDLVVGDLILLNTEHINLLNISDSSIKKLQD